MAVAQGMWACTEMLLCPSDPSDVQIRAATDTPRAHMSSVVKCVGASFTFCNPKPKEPLVYIKQHHQPTGWINSDRGCRKGSSAPSVRRGLDFRELKNSENTHSIRGKGQSRFWQSITVRATKISSGQLASLS